MDVDWAVMESKVRELIICAISDLSFFLAAMTSDDIVKGQLEFFNWFFLSRDSSFESAFVLD